MDAPTFQLRSRRMGLLRRGLVAAAVFGLIGAAGAPSARATSIETWPKEVMMDDGAPAKITYDTSFSNNPRCGFLVADITITNRTAGSLTWHASASQRIAHYSRYHHSGGDDGIGGRDFSFESTAEPLEVPGGATREFHVALPIPYRCYDALQIDGPYVPWPRTSASNSWVCGYGEGMPPAFLNGWLDAETNRNRAIRGGRVSVGCWTRFPTDWKEYTSKLLLICRREQWDELGAAQRGALVRYVSMGGTLAFVALDDSAQPIPAEFGVRAESGSHLPGVQIGLGSVEYLSRDGEELLKQVNALTDAICAEQKAPWLDPHSLPDWLVVKLPRAALIVVLLASALLAGPGALFWLAKRQQRHRLFVVLPAIAAGTTLVLLALIYLNDGTGGEGRRAVLAALLDDRPEMAVYQQQAARCGFLFRTDFTLPESALAEMHVPQSMAGGFMVGRNGGRCHGDWFRNRSATAQTIVHSVPTRAALELRPAADGGAPSVVSTFPAPLKELTVFTGGRTWRAAVVPPGTPTLLTEDPASAEQICGVLRRRLAEPFHHALDRLFHGTAMDDRFLATTDRLEGAPIATLESIRWADTIFVTGRVTEGRRP